jgi:hypothetical protein
MSEELIKKAKASVDESIRLVNSELDISPLTSPDLVSSVQLLVNAVYHLAYATGFAGKRAATPYPNVDLPPKRWEGDEA